MPTPLLLIRSMHSMHSMSSGAPARWPSPRWQDCTAPWRATRETTAFDISSNGVPRWRQRRNSSAKHVACHQSLNTRRRVPRAERHSAPRHRHARYVCCAEFAPRWMQLLRNLRGEMRGTARSPAALHGQRTYSWCPKGQAPQAQKQACIIETSGGGRRGAAVPMTIGHTVATRRARQNRPAQDREAADGLTETSTRDAAGSSSGRSSTLHTT